MMSQIKTFLRFQPKGRSRLLSQFKDAIVCISWGMLGVVVALWENSATDSQQLSQEPPWLKCREAEWLPAKTSKRSVKEGGCASISGLSKPRIKGGEGLEEEPPAGFARLAR